MHGMGEPAQGAAAAAIAPGPKSKARDTGGLKQRRAHGGEEAMEKMLSRLTSKLQEKRKTFAFGFAVENGISGKESDRDSRPLDDLIRELEVDDSNRHKIERKRKEKKKKAQKLAKKGAGKAQAKDKGDEYVVMMEEKSADADTNALTKPATEARSPPRSGDTSEGARADEAGAVNIGPPSKPLSPPPGLEFPYKNDEKKPLSTKNRRRKKSCATRVEEEKGVVVLHWDSWRDAATEEEKLRKRFGQGTRNLSAIARRGGKKGVGVIGLAGAALVNDNVGMKKDGSEDVGALLLNAFSFGFAL